VSNTASNLSDEELARQSQAGSLASFEELVSRHEGRIFRLLARCCGNESQAEDLTQITFVTAYRSLHQYDPTRPFGAWLSVIAHRKFIDHYRKRRLESSVGEFPEPVDANDPAALLDQREQHTGLWNRVRSLLGADQFSVLWLKYQEDLSVREIARLLRRTETSVKVLLFRARQALPRSLRPAEGQVRPQAEGASVLRHGLTPGPPDWEATGPTTKLTAQLK
jgi:RNA polymerase sigma-70 factor, ECF subfamily